MSERRSEGFVGDGVPWSAVFDPVANARALEGIQRRGLQAAGELVDRLVSVVDGARQNDGTRRGDGSGPTVGSPSSLGAAQSLGNDLIQLWADVMTRTLQAMARLAVPDADPTRQPTGGPVWVDVTTGRSSGPLQIELNGDGSPTTIAEVWLHNATTRPVGELRIHTGELRSSEGTVLPLGILRFEPDVLGELPARSSRGISVFAHAGGPMQPGLYRGVIQAAGAGHVGLAVELTVDASQ